MQLAPQTEFMMVGEKTMEKNGTLQKYYSLFVDQDGVMINTMRPDRTRTQYTCDQLGAFNYAASNVARGEYALFIDGNVRISGSLFVDNIVRGSNSIVVHAVPATGSTTVSGASLSAADALCLVDETVWKDIYWHKSPALDANIYYDGNLTIGGMVASVGNDYALNIAHTANRSIYKSQFCIQNTAQIAPSQVRVGILGSACNSPAVMNTSTNTPLEFHMGREQSFFDALYTCITSNSSGFQTVALELPVYSHASNAPHFAIDVQGNVGIKTNTNPSLSYLERVNQKTAYGTSIAYQPRVQPADLHVNGTIYANTIVLNDTDCNLPRSLDEIFGRKLSRDVPAADVLVGTFVPGDWRMNGRVGINIDMPTGSQILQNRTNQTIASNLVLAVNGTAAIHSNLHVYGNTYAYGSTQMATLKVDELAVFKQLEITNNLVVNGRIFVLDTNDSNIKYSVAFTTSASNVAGDDSWARFGQGMSTSGRIGVGVRNKMNSSSSPDNVYNQFTTVKYKRVLWEAEMTDNSMENWAARTVFMGHATHVDLTPTSANPTPSPSIESPSGGGHNDGSFIIMTPKDDSTHWKGQYTRHLQNIYMYPGQSVNAAGDWYLRSDNPPILGAFSSGRVGVKTFSPAADFHVHGDIAYDGSLIRIDAYNPDGSVASQSKLTSFKQVNYTNQYGASAPYVGGEYYEPGAAHLGVNTAAHPKYGLTVAGGIYSTDGYYDSQGRRTMAWYDASRDLAQIQSTLATRVIPDKMMSIDQVGIGTFQPYATLTIQNVNRIHGMTKLSLLKSDYDISSVLEFKGTRTDPWTVLHNDVRNTLEFGLGTSNVFQFQCQKERALWMSYNDALAKHQVVICGHIEQLRSALNPNASLTVGGDVCIQGDLDVLGNIRVRSSNVTITSNAIASLTPTANTDDVWISGDDIALTPNIGKMLQVGYDTAKPTFLTTRAPKLYVNQDNPSSDTVAYFKGTNPNGAFLVIANASGGRQLKIGATLQDSFVFRNELNQEFMKFRTDDANRTFVSVGEISAVRPTAQLQVSTSTSGENLFRLTKLSTGDAGAVAPELELHKWNVTDGTNRRWVLHGPDAACRQKLAFSYRTDVTSPLTGIVDPTSVASDEVFTLTSNGYMGIRTPCPQYPLDVAVASNENATLRLCSTTNIAQILFQASPCNAYGANDAAHPDYAIQHQNGILSIVQEAQNLGARSVLQVAASGNVGIGVGASASSNYALQVQGSVNATYAYYLADEPLFTLADLQKGALMVQSNLYFLPATDAGYDGGFHINWQQPSCNLFYVRGARMSANLMTLESESECAQIHLRTHGNPAVGHYDQIFRIASSNECFRIQHNRYPNPALYEHVLDSDNGYTTPFSLCAADSNTYPSTYDYSLRLQGLLNIQSDRDQAGVLLQSTSIVSRNCNIVVSFCNEDQLFDVQSHVRAQHVYFRNLWSNAALLPSATAYNGMFAVLDSNASAVFSVSNTWVGLLSKSLDGRIVLGSVSDPVYIMGNSYFNRDLAPMSVVGTNPPQWQPVNLGTCNAPFNNAYLSNALFLNGLQLHRNADGCLEILDEQGRTSCVTVDAVHLRPADPMNAPTLTLTTNPLTCNLYLTVGTTQYTVVRQRDAFQSAGITIGDPYSGTSNTPGLFTVYGASNGPMVNAPLMQFQQYGNGPLLNFQVSNMQTMLTIDARGNLAIGDGTDTLIRTSSNLAAASNVSPWTFPGLFNLTQQNTAKIGLYADWYASSNALVDLRVQGATQFQVDAFGNTSLGGAVRPRSNCMDAMFNVAAACNMPFLPKLDVAGQTFLSGQLNVTENAYFCKNVEIYGMNTVHGNQVVDSDRRLKKDLQRIEGALTKVQQLSGYTFQYQRDPVDRRSTGLIAQDVQAVLPEAVFENDAGMLSLAYGNLAGLLVEAIKELAEDVRRIAHAIHKRT